MGQRSRELTPTRSAAHALGAELRRRRVERGLSQAGLGEMVHHSAALVGKIEKAERLPSAEFCALVDAVLDTGGILSRMQPMIDSKADVRDSTIYRVRSAQTHLHNGDLDLACQELTTATGLVRRTGSTRSISTIREARRAMSPHDTEPMVRELDRALAEVVGRVA